MKEVREKMKECRKHHRWSLETGRNIKSKNHGVTTLVEMAWNLRWARKPPGASFNNLTFNPGVAKSVGRRTRPEWNPPNTAAL